MSKMLKELKRNLSINHKKIEDFTAIKDMAQGEHWDFIKALYQQPSPIEKMLGTIFNAIATSKKRRFLLSATVLQQMLEGDPNQTRKTVSGEDYKKVLGRILDAKIVKMIEPPSKFGKGERIAGLYEIIYPDIVRNVDFIDSYAIDPNPTSPKTSPEPTPATSHEYDNESESEHEYASDNAYATEPESKDDRQFTKRIVKSRAFGSLPSSQSPGRSSPSEGCPSPSIEVSELPKEIEDLELRLKFKEMSLQMGDNSVKDEVLKLRDQIKSKKVTQTKSMGH